jgi:[ribosomal protein S18]-alanine N-acetyltransferase
MPLSIRKAEPDDAADIRQIALNSNIDSWTTDQYWEEAGRSDAVFFVAHDSAGGIGFVSGRIVPSSTEGLDGEIYNIAVVSEFRGKGIGRELLGIAIKRFAFSGCGELWLEVRESNQNAIQFYENNGFVRITIRRNFYSSPVENAIVMRLTLVRKP